MRPEEGRVKSQGQSCRAEKEVRHRSKPGLVGMTEGLALLSSGLWLKEGQVVMRVLERWRNNECNGGCIPLSPPMR